MSKKILLADDSVTIQKVVSITLAHEDIDLTIVDNGVEAFAKAQQIRPDIILLDVVMPGKDGYQVCDQIKKVPELSHIPIILLTGTFEPFDEEKAEQVGANDYLKKPFESHSLINKIKEMSFKGAGAHAAPSAAGDSSGFIMGDETEIGSGEAKPSRAGAEASGFETPRESKPAMQTPREARVPKGRSEDIWSVEEFEDIAGPARDDVKLTTTSEEADPWGDVTISTDSVSDGFDIAPDRRMETPPSRGAGEPPRAGEGAMMGTGGFELGEEISEDELSQFLDEEGFDLGEGDKAAPETHAPPHPHRETGLDASFDEMGVEQELPPLGEDFDMTDFDEPTLGASTSGGRDDVFQLSDDDMEIPLEDVEDISLGEGVDDFSLGDEIQMTGDFDEASGDEIAVADDSFSLDDVEISPEFRDEFASEDTGAAFDEDSDFAGQPEEPRDAHEIDFGEPFESETKTDFDEIDMTETYGEDEMFVPEGSDDTDFMWEEDSRGEAERPFVDDIGAGTAEIDTSFSDGAGEFESQHRFESAQIPEGDRGDSGFDMGEETASVNERLISQAMEEVSSRVAGSMTGDLGGARPGTEEYDRAVNKIAREVIEKVAWEVVPELAEVLIKEEIKRLKGEKG